MSFLVGFGHCLPTIVHSNQTVEQNLGLEPGWVEQRTGFLARRYCGPDQSAGDLALEAARQALDGSGVNPALIGMTLLATSTPDHPLPGTAPRLAGELGLRGPAIDLMAACTGFLHALELADQWVRGTGQGVLLVAANKLSYRVDAQDRQTVGLFGDAAGAVVVMPSPTDGKLALQALGNVGGNQGSHWQQLMIPAGGSRLPIDAANVQSQLRYMKMESGREVFKLAVESMQQDCQQLLEEHHLNSQQIRWLIPHQASKRIVHELGKRLEMQTSQLAWWLEEFGNSSAATIPVALSLGMSKSRFSAGDYTMLAAAGAGMCHAASLLRVVATAV